MATNEHCVGLQCRFAQVGETTVRFDDDRFLKCESLLTANDEADSQEVFLEDFVSAGARYRERCGYAVSMILRALEEHHA